MGICESSKEKQRNIIKNNSPIEIINKEKKSPSVNDEDILPRLDTHPSSNSQENETKKPELVKYDDNIGKQSETSYAGKSKVISIFSSQNEEEVIINEVNKKIINKEGDFNNVDFKNLVKSNGGIIIKDKDQMSNVFSYQGLNPAFDLGKINKPYEIKSMRTVPVKSKEKKNLGNNTNHNNDKLRLSNRINVSFHDYAPQTDAFINVPKTDEPLPDLDELSTESPIPILRNSYSSQ